MKRHRWLFVVLIIVLVLCWATVSVQAQYPYGPIKVWSPRWVYYSGGYGSYWITNHGYGQFGGYYPGYYDIDLSRLSRRGQSTLGGAALGGIIGALAGGRKGAAIGAVSGGAIGWLASRGRGNDYRLPRSRYDPRGDRFDENRYDEDSFKIRNRTKYIVDIYDDNQFVFRLNPGDGIYVPRPRYQYRGYALMTGYGGQVIEKEIWLSATSYGWEIVY